MSATGRNSIERVTVWAAIFNIAAT